MSELPRRIVSQLRRFIGNRRHHKRVRTRLTFTLSLSDPRVSTNGSRRLPTLNGYTLDVSVTGLALIVPAIRIGEHYLAGADRKLHVKLELPSWDTSRSISLLRWRSCARPVSTRLPSIAPSSRFMMSSCLRHG